MKEVGLALILNGFGSALSLGLLPFNWKFRWDKNESKLSVNEGSEMQQSQYTLYVGPLMFGAIILRSFKPGSNAREAK